MFKDRLILITTAISVLGLQVAFWPLMLKAKSLPAEVPLWYTLPAASRLAPAQYLWLLPALAAVFLVLNLGLAYWLYRRYPMISQVLALYSTGLCVIAAVAIVHTILIYTSLL